VAFTYDGSEESGVEGFGIARGGDVGLILGFPPFFSEGRWIGDLNYLILSFFSTIIRCHLRVATSFAPHTFT
jgi:hypothetical protein